MSCQSDETPHDATEEGEVIKKGDVRPPYQRIASDLRAQIMSGDLGPGTQLPSTPQLVEQYEAANTTIQKAVSALRGRGLPAQPDGQGRLRP